MGQDPLAQLKDIHLPSQLESGWPALGMLLIVVVSIVCISAALVYFYYYKKQRKVQKQLIAELKNINLSAAQALNLSNQILKKAALHYYSRQEVANLHGLSWLQFLDTQLKEADRGFEQQSEIWLSLYQKSPQPANLAILQQVHTWLVHALPPKSIKVKKENGDV